MPISNHLTDLGIIFLHMFYICNITLCMKTFPEGFANELQEKADKGLPLERDPVHSTRYGRRRQIDGPKSISKFAPGHAGSLMRRLLGGPLVILVSNDSVRFEPTQLENRDAKQNRGVHPWCRFFLPSYLRIRQGEAKPKPRPGTATGLFHPP